VIRRIYILAALLLGTALTGSAWAHGGGPGLNYDPCAKRVGLYYVHMAVYQPEVNRFQEYCGKIPGGGKTLLVFDLVGAEMRKTPVGVDIFEMGGRTGSFKVESVPAAEHATGVIDMNLDLQPGHNYSAVVTVGEAPASVAIAFPITVNAWWNGLEIPALFLALVVGGALFYSLKLRRQHLAALRKAEMRNRIRAIGNA
jgi:hypothetical protein